MATIEAKIFTHLWYANEAEEAAALYTSIFPDSSITRIIVPPVETPAGPAGTVKIVDFELLGQRFQAISAGPHHSFNDAVSLVVLCEDQAELDRYWEALLANGGVTQACGWLTDRYGLRWQIVPRALEDLMSSDDQEGVKRVAEAMIKMIKLDIAELESAFHGQAA